MVMCTITLDVWYWHLHVQISERFGLVYVITKLGLLFVYDLETATPVYRNRISPDPIFIACNSDSTGGFYAINRSVGEPSFRGHLFLYCTRVECQRHQKQQLYWASFIASILVTAWSS